MSQDAKKSNLDANLRYINKISRPVVKFETIRDALEKKSTSGAKKPQDKEGSFFSEEDFKNFEKSYFNRK